MTTMNMLAYSSINSGMILREGGKNGEIRGEKVIKKARS